MADRIHPSTSDPNALEEEYAGEKIPVHQVPDALASLTAEERRKLERKLVRKLDARLMAPLIIMYILNYLDRYGSLPLARPLDTSYLL